MTCKITARTTEPDDSSAWCLEHKKVQEVHIKAEKNNKKDNKKIVLLLNEF